MRETLTLEILVISTYIYWSICSIYIIFTRTKDLFKTYEVTRYSSIMNGEDEVDKTPLTNWWIIFTFLIIVFF